MTAIEVADIEIGDAVIATLGDGAVARLVGTVADKGVGAFGGAMVYLQVPGWHVYFKLYAPWKFELTERALPTKARKTA